jgi:hypothetical protein
MTTSDTSPNQNEQAYSRLQSRLKDVPEESAMTRKLAIFLGENSLVGKVLQCEKPLMIDLTESDGRDNLFHDPSTPKVRYRTVIHCKLGRDNWGL